MNTPILTVAERAASFKAWLAATNKHTRFYEDYWSKKFTLRQCSICKADIGYRILFANATEIDRVPIYFCDEPPTYPGHNGELLAPYIVFDGNCDCPGRHYAPISVRFSEVADNFFRQLDADVVAQTAAAAEHSS